MVFGLRVLVTSVVRHTDQQQASGIVRVIDYETKRVLMKSAVPESVHRAKDPNPRGGLRGARGVTTDGARLVIANTERLLVFDPYWKLVGDITHPLMGGVHDILAEPDGIWITCTNADLLLKLNWTGKMVADWEWRVDRSLIAGFGFRSLPKVDRTLDYRDPESMRDAVRNVVHLNAVTRGPNGLLLSFGRILSAGAYRKQRVMSVLGQLARPLGIKSRPHRPAQGLPVSKVEGSSFALVLRHEDGSSKMLKHAAGTNVPNHNVIQIDNWLVYNDSNAGEVVVSALDERSSDRRVQIPGQPSFPRGLVQLGRGHVLVGSQAPAAIYQVDLAAGRVVSTFLLDGEPNESVYGICLIPPSFADPPTHLC